MGISIFIVFLVTNVCVARSTLVLKINRNRQSTQAYSTPFPSSTTPGSTPQPTPTPTPTLTPTPTPEIWTYIGIGIGVALVLIAQSICFCIYIRKLKSSQSGRKIDNIAIIPRNENSEDHDRYQREPSHHSRLNANTTKPEQHHSSSLYGYEVVKDDRGVRTQTEKPELPPTSTLPKGKRARLPLPHDTEEKPEPPPTSTLPKRNRARLPFPPDTDGSKCSTLSPQSNERVLQQRGRQGSMVPTRPAININVPAVPARSPQTRRLPILIPPVRPPVQKPRRDLMTGERSQKIYESLPDLRHIPKPPTANPPLIRASPPRLTPDLHMPRRLVKHQQCKETPSPILPPKPRYSPKPRNAVMNERSSIYESLPDIRALRHQVPPTLDAPPPDISATKPNVSSVTRTRRVPEPESLQNELLQKFKNRAHLTSLAMNTRAPPTVPKKPPVAPPPEDWDDLSDNEWTIEEIKQINMYNV